MLQIYCYGPTTSGFLDLPPQASLDIEALAPLFDEDLTFGEISLPINIPWTPNNLRITNFANHLRNGGQQLTTFKIDVYDSGFPEIPGGKLTILEKNGQLSMKRGSFAANISGSRGLFGNAIRGRQLPSLPLGGPITFTEASSRQFAYAHATGAYPSLSYIGFAPVAIKDFFNTELPDYDGEFLARDTVNNVIVTGSGPTDWTFGRPNPDTPTTAVASGNSLFLDYRTIPFYQLAYIFRQCFTTFGYQPSGQFFTQPWFSKLYLFNNYAIERYATGTSTDVNRTINPANHVPDISIRDFIKAVCTTFGMYPIFGAAGQVTFRFRANTLTNAEVFDITPLVARSFSSILPTPDQEPPTAVAYDFGSDSVATDRLPDLTGKNIVATVATAAQLATLDIGRTFTTADLVLVQAENIYYRPADATGIPVVWEAWADALYPARLSQAAGQQPTSDNNYTLPIAPLASHIVLNTSTAAYEYQGYQAIQCPGSYINNNLRTIRQPCPLRMLYIGSVSPTAGSHPVSHYHNRYSTGQRRSAYSLALTGPQGIGTTLHLPWLRTRAPELVKVQVTVNTDTLARIRAATQLQIHNSRYLLYRTERSIPLARHGSTITLELALV